MDMGQSLGSWSLAKERSNVLHSLCLSQPGYIPVQPLFSLSATLIYAFPYKYYYCYRVCRQEANSQGGRQLAERGMLLPTSLNPQSLMNRTKCCVYIASTAHLKYFVCQMAGMSLNTCPH